MKTPLRFIVIDDDPINNSLCKLFIKQVLPDAEIVDFLRPQAGLEYIETVYACTPQQPTVVLLDINMPVMSGWEFLEMYDKMDKDIRERLTIYMLSSSVDFRDKEKATNNPHVKGYLTKPLQGEYVKKIMAENPAMALD